MLGRSAGSLRRRRSSSKSSATRNRVLRSEQLEPREMLSGSSLSSSLIAPVRTAAPVNTAPVVAQAINANMAVAGKTASLSVLGRDDGGESRLVYNWSVAAAPAGGTAIFNINGTNAAKYTTVTFTKAGTYNFSVRIVDAGRLSVTSTRTVVVSPTLTSIRLTSANGQLVNPNAALAVPGVSQTIVAQGLDQFGNALAAQPAFTWSTTTTPAGAPRPTLATRGTSATVTFGKAGNYGFSVQARGSGAASIARTLSVNVTQVLSSIANASTAPVYVSGTSTQLAVPTFRDQFRNAMTVPGVTWSTTYAPAGATAPRLTTSGGVTTAAFGMAGTYYLTGRVVNVPSASFVAIVVVNQTLTRISVSPNTASVYRGTTQQFTAQGFDQFQRQMTTAPAVTWNTSGGTISNSGVLTAPGTIGNCTVTARNGSVTGTATVVVTSAGNLQNAALASLVQRLDADGSINRQDMIQILRSAGVDGVVDAREFADLKTILNQAGVLNIPNYVQALAADVINGNAANATFQGQRLGNLAAGSSAAQLNKLIDKWFLGADHPTLCNSSLVYRSVAGSLFPHTPSHTDEFQGQLGDCYFISALGTIADSNPTAIQNMFIDNGDGTFTVRFYTGNYGTIYNTSDGSISAGFTNSVITADYVTVDRMLPVSTTGILVYADYGASYVNSVNSLWLPLAEKAYAQWNETGKEGRDGKNAYASIQGGWMATVDAQVLGHNATDYIMTTTSKQVAINALAAKKAVTIGTLQWSGTKLGLYGSHAYAIVGYNASTDTFTLYNPWGSSQPGQLTWSQLQATCSQLAVAETSGSVPITSVVVAAADVRSPARVSSAPLSVSAAVFSEPDLPPDMAKTRSLPAVDGLAASRNERLSDATSAASQVFRMVGNREPAVSHEIHFGGRMPSTPDASDEATFATDEFLSQDDSFADSVRLELALCGQ